MGLFLLLSTIPNTKFYMELQARKMEKENYLRRAGQRRAEMRDKHQIDNLLKSSLRDDLIRE